MIDGVDSETNRVGQTFAASMDQPVTMGGETIIPARSGTWWSSWWIAKESGQTGGPRGADARF